jgi:hypothetical protein
MMYIHEPSLKLFKGRDRRLLRRDRQPPVALRGPAPAPAAALGLSGRPTPAECWRATRRYSWPDRPGLGSSRYSFSSDCWRWCSLRLPMHGISRGREREHVSPLAIFGCPLERWGPHLELYVSHLANSHRPLAIAGRHLRVCVSHLERYLCPLTNSRKSLRVSGSVHKRYLTYLARWQCPLARWRT